MHLRDTFVPTPTNSAMTLRPANEEMPNCSSNLFLMHINTQYGWHYRCLPCRPTVFQTFETADQHEVLQTTANRSIRLRLSL